MRWICATLVGLLLVIGAGCGGSGGGKGKPPARKPTKPKYAAVLDKICIEANSRVASLRLTGSMTSWKGKGDRAVSYVQDAIDAFESAAPPEELKKEAARFNRANERILADVRAAADAANSGNQKKFAAALQKQRADGQESSAAARLLGSAACA